MKTSRGVGERLCSRGQKAHVRRWLLGLTIVVTMSFLVAACGSTESVVTSTETTAAMPSSTTTTTQPSTTTPVKPTTTAPAPTTTTSQTTTSSSSPTPGDGHISASGDISRSAHTFETRPGETAEILIISGSDDLEFQGTLEGTWKNQYIMELNTTTGKFTMTADIIFTGKVNGKEGTFTATEVGGGQFYTADSGTISGHTTIVEGTDELADLRGVIDGKCTFGPQAFAGTYTGDLYFE